MKVTDTSQLQKDSVRAFARRIGFTLDPKGYFVNPVNRVSWNRMKDWHNGTFPYVGVWKAQVSAGKVDHIWQVIGLRPKNLDQYALLMEDWKGMLTNAYDARLVKNSKAVWSKKQQRFVFESHYVKLMPDTELK